MKSRIIFGLVLASVSTAVLAATETSTTPPSSSFTFAPIVSALQNFYVGAKIGPSISSDDTKFEPDVRSGYQSRWSVPDGGFNHTSMGTEPLYGAVFGYQLNPTIGFDADYIYRANFKWSEQFHFSDTGEDREKTIYGIGVQTWMLNANFSPITWNHFTPYVSIGAGLAVNRTGGMKNIDPDTAGLAEGAGRLNGETKTNFSWQAGLGFNYWFSPNWKMDLAYHFRDIGDIETGHTLTSDSGNTIDPFKANHVHLNELSLGLGYQF